MNKKIYFKPEISTGFMAAFKLLRFMSYDVSNIMFNSDDENRALKKELLVGLAVLSGFMYDEFLKHHFNCLY